MRLFLQRSVICLFLCLMPVAMRAIERYKFSNLSISDGLSQITVICIYQDTKGFMWFGTRNGLNRYDGYRFEVFLTDPENHTTISDNHILNITEDREGYLWIGTNNGLNKMNPHDGTFTRYMFVRGKSGALPAPIVQSFFIDSQDRIWVGTDNGLCRYNPDGNTFERVSVFGEILRDNPVYDIKEHDGKLYLGTMHGGLIVFDPGDGSYKIHRHDKSDVYSIAHDFVRSILIDSDDNLWLGTHGGGVCVRRKGEDRFQTYNSGNALSNDKIRALAEAPQGYILIATFDGLNVIDPLSGETERYVTYNAEDGDLSHYSVYSLYFDSSHTLWVGTYAGGIDYYNQYALKFEFNDLGRKIHGTFGISGAMVETNDYLYISSEGSGIIELNLRNMSTRSYRINDTGRRSAYSTNIIKSLCLDGDRLLCATNTGTIYSFDLSTRRFSLYYDLGVTDPVYYLGRDIRGNLMAGGVNSVKGLIYIWPDGRATDRFRLADGSVKSFGNVRYVLETEPQRFLIGTRNDGLYDFDMPAGKLIHYKTTDGKQDGKHIPDNYVSNIFRDSKGNIWIGTFGGGFCRFDPAAGSFETYSTQDGLGDNNICSIVEDSFGNLWISTISGVCEFNTVEKTFTNYNFASGIQIDEFTPHSGLRLSNDRIVFGGNNGIVTFNPHVMYHNPFIPPVVLRNLYVDNRIVTPGDGTGILGEPLNMQKEVVLRYNQSNIAIEYSSLNYIFPEANQYLYRMEGFDTKWNKVGARRMAYYTNIPPGKYRFQVMGSNNDGLWNNTPTEILITIKPPIWKTWWAYIIYMMLFSVVFILILRYLSEKHRLESGIRLKEAEAVAQQEFHAARTRLFTNFSHELRTPLTLIMSPLTNMVEKEKGLSDEGNRNLALIQDNTERLLRLVNNLMDFQKNESGKLQLRVSRRDFVGFARDMTHAFSNLAERRGIVLRFASTDESIVYWFDQRHMEKVFFNYLSNAFKNVPDGGTVEVRVGAVSLFRLREAAPGHADIFTDNKIKYILMEISNTGQGIPEEELENIFIPFYQVAQNEHSVSGTGLGLSLSKSIIDMHHGVIWAESPGGQGAVFRTILPLDKNRYTNLEIAEDYLPEDHMTEAPAAVPDTTEGETRAAGNKKNSVLVVEDNADVRRYIISLLRGAYNIHEAANGETALDKAFTHLPDLIISDVMMPRTDGMAMARRLKEDLRTSHIPIILITAKTMAEDMKEGYRIGVDDYIAKPFNSSVLVARVENLIRSREKLKSIYGKRFSLESLGVEVVSVDERFMTRLYEVMERNVANPVFNIDVASREIGMSRAQFYRKVKAITNLSPNEFIRNFRLEMAAKILKETGSSISEAYVAVGFNSLAYFSNCFKNLYGITPSEYMAQSAKTER